MGIPTENKKNTNLLLYRDSILFYKDQDWIYEKDIIAEMPINNRLEWVFLGTTVDFILIAIVKL